MDASRRRLRAHAAPLRSVAEYLRVDLGKDTLASNAAEFTGPDIDIFNATVKRDTNTNIVRVRA